MRKSRLSSYKQDRFIEFFFSGSTARIAASLVGMNRKDICVVLPSLAGDGNMMSWFAIDANQRTAHTVSRQRQNLFKWETGQFGIAQACIIGLIGLEKAEIR